MVLTHGFKLALTLAVRAASADAGLTDPVDLPVLLAVVTVQSLYKRASHDHCESIT